MSITASAQVVVPDRGDLAASAPSRFPAAIIAAKAPLPKKRTQGLALSSDDWLRYLEPPSTLDDDIADDLGIVLRDGGVLRLSTDLDISLGLDEGQLSWEGSGGFAAYGRDRKVRIAAPVGAPLIWGKTPNFLGADDVLILGARDADATLIWDSALNLGSGSAPRTVRVIKGEDDFSGAAVRFDRGFSGDSGSSVRFEGDGRADLNAANDAFFGRMIVSGAELHFTGAGSLKRAQIDVRGGGHLILDNLGTYSADRLRDAGQVNLYSSTFAYWGGQGLSKETAGTVALLGGANTIDVVNNSRTAFSRLILAGISRAPSATVNFTNSRSANGEFGTGATKTPQLKITNTGQSASRVTLTGGILPYATVNGRDFATLRDGFVVAYDSYYRGDTTGWLSAHNVSLDTNQQLTTSRSINSLRIVGDSVLTLSPNTRLTINAGALLSTGRYAVSEIKGGELVLPKSEFFAHVFGSVLDISSDIRQSSGSHPSGVSLIKDGDGRLYLSGKDLSGLRGTHHIHNGGVYLQRQGAGVGLAGHIVVGDGALAVKEGHHSSLYLMGSDQLQRSASITLRGTHYKRLISSSPSDSTWTISYSAVLGIDGDGAQQFLDTLTIDGDGIISFAGGDDETQVFGFDHILMANGASRLVVDGFREGGNHHLLINRNAREEIARYLDQIYFDGYDGPSGSLIDYNADYFEIVPGGRDSCAPEPAAYGALLGTLSLGFFAWRKRVKGSE